MDQAQAEARALGYLRHGWDHPDDALALVPNSAVAKPYGWVFSYQSRRFLETGDERYLLVGNGPVVVLDDGTVRTLGSARPPAEEIAAFEREHGLVTARDGAGAPPPRLQGLPVWVGAARHGRYPVLALTHPGLVSAELTVVELERLPLEGPALLHKRDSVTVPWTALDRIRTDGAVGLRIERREDFDVTVRFATPPERDEALVALHQHLVPSAPMEQLRRPIRKFFELSALGLLVLGLGFGLPWMVETSGGGRVHWLIATVFNTLGPTGFRVLGVVLATGVFASVIVLAVRNPVRTGFRVRIGS